jgi:hypothetical protein
MRAKERYRLYIDERGNPHLSDTATAGNRYLTLLGSVLQYEYYTAKFRPELAAIKRKFFSNDPDIPIILHLEDIVQRNGVFNILEDPTIRDDFNRSMTDFYTSQSFTLIAVAVDKTSHRLRYGRQAKHPYHFCIESMLEQYCIYLLTRQGVGDIYAESRGRKEDALLQLAFHQLCQHGTKYLSSAQIRSCIHCDEIEFREKKDNVYGLQLSDLLVRCSQSDVLASHGIDGRAPSSYQAYISKTIQPKYKLNLATGHPKGGGLVLLSAEKTAAPDECLVGRATTAEAAVRN